VVGITRTKALEVAEKNTRIALPVDSFWAAA